MPPDSGVPVPGAIPGSTTSMSTRVPRSGPSRACAIASSIHRLDPAFLHLGLLFPTHPLAAHPLERVSVRPVATQPDLDEVRPGDPPLVDQPAHRLPLVPTSRSHRSIPVSACASSCINSDARRIVHAGNRGGGRIRDRVVAAQDDRDRRRRGRRAGPPAFITRRLRSGRPGTMGASPASTTVRTSKGVRLGLERPRPRGPPASSRGRFESPSVRTAHPAEPRSLVVRGADDRDVCARVSRSPPPLIAHGTL